jgi:hypothetical protein
MMSKHELIQILKKLLQTDVELDFLMKLTVEDLQTLAACVRSRVD